MKHVFTRICKISKDKFKELISKTEITDKNTLLDYMRKTPETAFTSQPVYDKMTGDKVSDADNMHDDGEYYWFEEDIYHFEKYNIKLSDEFIDHVLRVTKE